MKLIFHFFLACLGFVKSDLLRVGYNQIELLNNVSYGLDLILGSPAAGPFFGKSKQ